MTKRTTATAGGFFSASFAAAVVSAASVSPRLLNGSMAQGLLTILLSFVITSLAAIPVWLLDCQNLGLLEAARLYLGAGTARVLGGLYYAAGTYYSYSFLAFFLVFIENTLNPAVPVWVIALCIVGASLYGAWKGMATAARAGIFAAALIVLSFVLMFIALARQMEIQRMQMFSVGTWTPQEAVVIIARRSTMLMDIMILLPRVSGKKTAGFLWCNVCGHVLSVVLIVFIAVTLGIFAVNQLFPAYTLAVMADLGAVQRLDMVFLVLWIVSLVMRITLNLLSGSYAFQIRDQHLLQKTKRVPPRLWLMAIQALVVAVFAAATADFFPLQQHLFSSYFVVYSAGVLFLVIPILILLIVWLRTGRKGKGYEK